MRVQCTRSCGGGIQFRSVTCVGGRACVMDDRPAEHQPCNTRPCSSDDDVTLSDDKTIFTATSRDNVSTTASLIAMATATESRVIRSSAAAAAAAVPQTTRTMTSSATAATSAPATTPTATTTQATTTTRRPIARYRWMALFWSQVLVRFRTLTYLLTPVDC